MMVTPPKVDKSLWRGFKEVLKQVNANYTQVEDTIIIGPAAPKGREILTKSRTR